MITIPHSRVIAIRTPYGSKQMEAAHKWLRQHDARMSFVWVIHRERLSDTVMKEFPEFGGKPWIQHNDGEVDLKTSPRLVIPYSSLPNIVWDGIHPVMMVLNDFDSIHMQIAANTNKDVYAMQAFANLCKNACGIFVTDPIFTEDGIRTLHGFSRSTPYKVYNRFKPKTGQFIYTTSAIPETIGHAVACMSTDMRVHFPCSTKRMADTVATMVNDVFEGDKKIQLVHDNLTEWDEKADIVISTCVPDHDFKGKFDICCAWFANYVPGFTYKTAMRMLLQPGDTPKCLICTEIVELPQLPTTKDNVLFDMPRAKINLINRKYLGAISDTLSLQTACPPLWAAVLNQCERNGTKMDLDGRLGSLLQDAGATLKPMAFTYLPEFYRSVEDDIITSTVQISILARKYNCPEHIFMCMDDLTPYQSPEISICFERQCSLRQGKAIDNEGLIRSALLLVTGHETPVRAIHQSALERNITDTAEFEKIYDAMNPQPYERPVFSGVKSVVKGLNRMLSLFYGLHLVKTKKNAWLEDGVYNYQYRMTQIYFSEPYEQEPLTPPLPHWTVPSARYIVVK